MGGFKIFCFSGCFSYFFQVLLILLFRCFFFYSFVIFENLIYLCCFLLAFFPLFFGFFNTIFLLLILIVLFVFVVCVCVWEKVNTSFVLMFVPTTKEGFTYFVLVLATHLDYGVLVGCLLFVACYNFNNDYVIDFFNLIWLCSLYIYEV